MAITAFETEITLPTHDHVTSLFSNQVPLTDPYTAVLGPTWLIICDCWTQKLGVTHTTIFSRCTNFTVFRGRC